MRRTAMVLAVGVLLVALSAGSALALAIYGTLGDDTFRGTKGSDEFYGKSGDDWIGGRGGNDALFGNGGRDLVYGGPGADRISGGPGDDQGTAILWALSGGPGNDLVSGDGGDDYIVGDSGRDILKGGPGDDHIASTTGESYDAPNSTDKIYCGTGFDTVYADPADKIADDCEIVRFPNAKDGR